MILRIGSLLALVGLISLGPGVKVIKTVPEIAPKVSSDRTFFLSCAVIGLIVFPLSIIEVDSVPAMILSLTHHDAGELPS
jgi:hypothetical protein